mgnify:FL=1
MILGLVEVFLYGVYIAVVFVPLFNYFEGGRRAEATNLTAMTEALHHR